MGREGPVVMCPGVTAARTVGRFQNSRFEIADPKIWVAQSEALRFEGWWGLETAQLRRAPGRGRG